MVKSDAVKAKICPLSFHCMGQAVEDIARLFTGQVMFLVIAKLTLN